MHVSGCRLVSILITYSSIVINLLITNYVNNYLFISINRQDNNNCIFIFIQFQTQLGKKQKYVTANNDNVLQKNPYKI